MSLREALGSLNAAGDEHVKAVMALAEEYGHSIRPVASVVELRRYTCLVYALGFQGMPEYESIAMLNYVNVFAGVDFATWLLERGHLKEVTAANAELGSYVLYSDGERAFLHIGVMRDDGRVDSKWGNQGLYSACQKTLSFRKIYLLKF